MSIQDRELIKLLEELVVTIEEEKVRFSEKLKDNKLTTEDLETYTNKLTDMTRRVGLLYTLYSVTPKKEHSRLENERLLQKIQECYHKLNERG